jgi:hypothetical protein
VVAVAVGVGVAALSFARNLVPPDGGTAVAVEPYRAPLRCAVLGASV